MVPAGSDAGPTTRGKVKLGGPPTEQRSGSRPNGGLVDHTPLQQTRRSRMVPAGSDAGPTTRGKVKSGGPPTEQRSGSRPNGGLVDHTPLQQTRLSRMVPAGSDADATTLEKIKPSPGCSCRATGAGTGCQKCRAAGAAMAPLRRGLQWSPGHH
ncbi:hypothetical protein MRX96_005405 [Rhipicephalus microplus]